ncbi:hypothetical protein M2401_006765 [Pseudomonas sp. JUb42]|uniref:hypothetical protein n=1 Tax=Pseudomonas sp. JUb42 TaxID=2940611 RepID=UPI00216A8738|nr:hypothetical protein [Pseudomonas sp. JUb42]MCS3472997.1 hypothetical protein [Pseudomonas sp. JUb42]
MTDQNQQLSVPCEVVLCQIGSSGNRTISPEIEAWSEALAGHAKNQTRGQIGALVWSYRQGNTEYLSVDLISDQGGFSLTFITGSPHDFGVDDVEVPDMTEAIAMAMLLLKKINAMVTFYI